MDPRADCVPPDLLQGFADGSLPPAVLERVEAHVEACALCRELVADAARAAPLGELESAPDRAAEQFPHSPSGASARFGRYELLGPIGAGGMGVVYAARDPQLDRRVALKMLRPAEGTGEGALREAVLREARAMARLSHPNVVPVYEAGEVDGRVFLAMELVEGGALGEWLQARPRALDEILEVFVGAARGLGAAHAAGLVHRDFKPANVLLGTDGRARVTDFGLARALHPAPGAAPAPMAHDSAARDSVAHLAQAATATAPAGSPAYMAPEQLRGEPAGPRADVFSFCVALHEAVYGARPFAGATAAELLRAATDGRVRAEPEGARVPAALRAAILRGLHADAGRRFDSMAQVIAALERARTSPQGGTLALRASAAAVAALALILGLFSLRSQRSGAVLATRAALDTNDVPATTGGDELDAQLHLLLQHVGADAYVAPPAFKERVRQHIAQLLARRSFASEWKRRRELRPRIAARFAALGIPEDLADLAWVESRFDPAARSPSGSLGLWQLMPDTARSCGLVVDDRVDERTDVDKSTDAAARYLARLLTEFGSDSFLLAIASYNLGEQQMRDALQQLAREPGGFRKDKRDFWNLYARKMLPDETREYVPKVLAAAIVGGNPRRYGLE